MKNQIYVTTQYKDTLFRMLFREKLKLLELYNAINDTDYQNPEELEVVTLENAVYMSIKNDVSCLYATWLAGFGADAAPKPASHLA